MSNAAVRLCVNALAPLGLYELLIRLGVADFAALAGAAAIPAIWTIAHWLWRRRVEWIGLFAVLGFAIELAVAALLGGNSLLLKTHAAVLTGPLGLVLLASAWIGRPLLLPLLQRARPETLARSGALARLSSDPAAKRRLSLATAIIGAVLAVHAAVVIALACALPTASFLLVSKAANWILGGAAIGLLMFFRRRRMHRLDGQGGAGDPFSGT
jgi:uncharacterized membrane protein